MEKERFTPIVLVLGALVMLALGVVGAVAPHKLLDPLGIQLAGATSLNEMRAGYGGRHLALAAFYLLGAMRPSWRTPAIWLLALHMAGLVAFRTASLLIDGSPDPFVFKPWGLEALLLVLSGIALLRRRASATT